ncbi:TraR/DksA C4-type zinc finger protein [Muriicola soli]|uniref:TraR/DksA family transcriptional regulator n=1 Tax=Muriicola soli TaxID=2507538 RepID=A0A411E722_9FLAO|nr:TraR/DksA C4-type zinc finger protein [Muriicola soli]QBA63437.1 TraR/DksA family transcriptional regulator [Muriicola soli]
MDSSELKALLKSAITRTEKRIAQYRDLSRPVSPDNAIGRVSRMDAINNKGVMEAALRKAEDQLRGLKRNFSMLGTDDFGKCLKCREKIPIERILLAPESSFCVNCAR